MVTKVVERALSTNIVNVSSFSTCIIIIYYYHRFIFFVKASPKIDILVQERKFTEEIYVENLTRKCLTYLNIYYDLSLREPAIQE